MRRNDRAVTDPSEITHIMSRCEVLHLAIAAEPAPYLLPVNFGMEPDGLTLYVHGAMEGTKYDLLARNPRVGFEMECTSGLVLDETGHSCTMNYESVMGWGTVSEVTNPGEKLHALDCIMKQYHSEDFSYNPAVAERTRILCLNIQERTGKRRMKILGGNKC